MGIGDSGWNLFAIEHPNVDMARFTDPFYGYNPETGPPPLFREPPAMNLEKAFSAIEKLRNPFQTFAPVRASEGNGRYTCKKFFISSFQFFI